MSRIAKRWHMILLAVAQLLAIACCAQEEDFSNDFTTEDLKKSIFEYRPNPDRIKLKTQVDDLVIQRFYQGLPISIRIPRSRKIISSVLVSKPNSFKSKPMTVRPRSSILGRDLIVAMSPELIERLDYQPLRLIIYQSNMNRILLAYSDEEDNPPPVQTQNIQPEFIVRLRPNNSVAARFAQTENVAIMNDVISTDFPLHEIQGIFFDQNRTNSANIVLKSGDSISGRHSWNEGIEFTTKWGTETIPLEDIVSITRGSFRSTNSGDAPMTPSDQFYTPAKLNNH
ncbi:MAG: hypothetical protein AAGA30_01050 [Planctomycetota bacterium]